MLMYAVLAVHSTQYKILCRKFVFSIKLRNKTKTKQNQPINLKKLGYFPASATGCFDPAFHNPHVKWGLTLLYRYWSSILTLQCYDAIGFGWFLATSKVLRSYATFHPSANASSLFPAQTDRRDVWTQLVSQLQHSECPLSLCIIQSSLTNRTYHFGWLKQ